MTGDSNWSSDVETAESSKLPDCQLDNPRGYRGFDGLSQESQALQNNRGQQLG
jgi:hypothetical protein